ARSEERAGKALVMTAANTSGLARDIAKVTKTIADLAAMLDMGKKRVLTPEGKKTLESTITRLNARIGHLTSIPVMHTATSRSSRERIVEDLEPTIRGVVAALVRVAHGVTNDRIIACRDELRAVGLIAGADRAFFLCNSNASNASPERK
ncbi:MAG: hypothetical protein WCJ64_23440, partial [Rhodospirillaceae bacterium]